MFTEEQLKQLREVIRDEVKTAVEPLATKEEVAAVDRKIDALRAEMQEGFKQLTEDIGEYLNKLEPRVTHLEHRLDDLEEQLDFPKPQ
jgi:uncharacterized protein involved in exopolysaccharide biosynthesis